jgi:hypothetical protein
MLAHHLLLSAGSPLSLRELCRCHVRVSLAAQALCPGKNLPEMLLELSPPDCKHFLLMQTSDLAPECDDPQSEHIQCEPECDSNDLVLCPGYLC